MRATTISAYSTDPIGSGEAIAMKLAGIMASWKPASTIVFATVAKAEHGLHNNAFPAQSYKNASMKVQGKQT